MGYHKGCFKVGDVPATSSSSVNDGCVPSVAIGTSQTRPRAPGRTASVRVERERSAELVFVCSDTVGSGRLSILSVEPKPPGSHLRPLTSSAARGGGHLCAPASQP